MFLFIKDCSGTDKCARIIAKTHCLVVVACLLSWPFPDIALE